jgi:phosphoglycerate dehydrogenase-like enzyme
MLKIAILDDYARVALELADWSAVPGAEIAVFDRHLGADEAIDALAQFDVLCTIRERMALPRSLLERLPRLKLVTIIGLSLPNLDLEAATELGIAIVHPDFQRPAFAGIGSATPELTWGLMLATIRHITAEDRRLRQGEWQRSIGFILAGKTLGLLGLGRIGQRMAQYANAFGMKVIAWSQNLTAETASAHGAARVDKDELFRRADILSIHVQLSPRTRGLVTAAELDLMQPDAYLINTSRGPIVDEAALIRALESGRLAGAGLDVFDLEPLPADHPFRRMDQVTLTPHLGYVTRETLRAFYGDMPDAIAAYQRGQPIRVVNPVALAHAKHRPPG